MDERAQYWLGWLKKLILLPASLVLRHVEFVIPGENGAAAVSGLYVGEGLSFAYYQTLYRATGLKSRRIPVWSLGRAVRNAVRNGRVVLVEVNTLLQFLAPPGGWHAPAWVRLETDLAGERYRLRRRGIERGWGQKARRQGYRCVLARTPGDLNTFFDDFYVPYADQRHGESASLRGRGELRRALRSGFLLQVWRGDAWVAGLVASRPGRGSVRLLAVGVNRAHPSGLRDGAVAAAYYFLFGWAVDNGLRTVDFCGGRPHLWDGVFQHKSLWAAEPRSDPRHHTGIVLFVAGDAFLPAVVTGQLVERAGRLLPLAGCLNDGPRGEGGKDARIDVFGHE